MTFRERAAGWALLSVLIAPAAGMAQEVEDGVYVGGSFAATFENFSNTRPFDFDEALGTTVRLGSRVHPLVAIEAQYEWTGVFEAEELGAEIDLEFHMITANGKLFLFPGAIEPYLMAGMGYGRGEIEGGGTLTGSDRGDGFVLRVGTGAQVGLIDWLSLDVGAGFLLPAGDIDDFSYFSVNAGLNVHFRGL